MSSQDKQGIHVHRFDGCRPAPLASYLKALGIFRLIAEGPDAKARGWWQKDCFHLATKLSKEEIERFFLDDYQPTPLLAPWNGGSGFFPKDNKTAIDSIRQSVAPRFAPYREAITIAESAVSHIGEKPSKGDEKNGVITACRRNWRGSARQWIDAALTLGWDGEPAFPAMLGTGGNDGRLDFTNNFMQRLVSLFDAKTETASAVPDAVSRLALALWSTPCDNLESAAIGQFLPCSAGGPNGANGFDGGIKVNAWDFVFMLEGAVVFAAGLSRRCSSAQLPQASAPFAVRSSACGYESASTADAGARGEQWMPMWNHPARFEEIQVILREGRCTLGKRPAGRGVDMARAIARMGVNRGIHQFERYGYIERNGLSNLAVPLGRFDVVQRKHQRLLDEASPWLDRLRQAAQDKLAPASIQRAYRNCEQAVFNCAKYERSSDFLELLMAMAAAEDQFIASPKFSGDRAQPIPSLSDRWLAVVEEEGTNFRLAVALASQFGFLKGQNKTVQEQSIRIHWVPLSEKSRFQFSKSEQGINLTPDQCACGLDLERALIYVVKRRLIAMNQGETWEPVNAQGDSQSVQRFPIRPRNDSLGAEWEYIAAFLNYETDDARILSIARGLMTLRWPRNFQFAASNEVAKQDGLKAAFGILRLVLAPHTIRISTDEIDTKHDVPCNSMVFQRLAAGDLSGAFRIATRQVALAGLRSKVPVATGDPAFARRLAAAMGFGMSSNSYSRLALTVTARDASKEPPQEVMLEI